MKKERDERGYIVVEECNSVDITCFTVMHNGVKEEITGNPDIIYYPSSMKYSKSYINQSVYISPDGRLTALNLDSDMDIDLKANYLGQTSDILKVRLKNNSFINENCGGFLTPSHDEIINTGITITPIITPSVGPSKKPTVTPTPKGGNAFINWLKENPMFLYLFGSIVFVYFLILYIQYLKRPHRRKVIFPYILPNEYKDMAIMYTKGDVTLWKGYHSVYDRVVLKILRDDLYDEHDNSFYEDSVRRLEDEAEAGLLISRNTSSKNVVHVFEKGFTEDQHQLLYMTMKEVEGDTLHKILEQKGKLEEKDACKIALYTLNGLIDIHSVDGFVHKDIKPDNIMVQGLGGNPIVTIIDLGQVKVDEECGTPPYIAPEVFDRERFGKSVTGKADVFSLGIVFYEMLTGEKLFADKVEDKDDWDHWEQVIINSEIVLPDTINPVIAPLIYKMLERHPGERPDAKETKDKLINIMDEFNMW